MENLIFNPDFRLWGNGTSARPTGWDISTNVGGGTLPTIARITGHVYPHAAQLTRQNANAFMMQNVHGGVLPGAPKISALIGKYLTYAALVKFSHPEISGNSDYAALCAPTLSDGVYETHADSHRGYGEYRLMVGHHLVKESATQIAFNALTVKQQTANAAGVFSAEAHWAGLFIGQYGVHEIGFDLSYRYGGVSSLEFSSCPGNTLAASATAYLGKAGLDAQEDYVTFPMPFNGILRNLLTRAGAAPGTGESYTYTQRADGVDLGLSCQAIGGAQPAGNTADQVYVPEGANVCLKIVASAGAAPTNHRATVQMERVPIQ